MALGLTILMKVPAPSKQLGPVVIMPAWFAGVYGYFLLTIVSNGDMTLSGNEAFSKS